MLIIGLLDLVIGGLTMLIVAKLFKSCLHDSECDVICKIYIVSVFIGILATLVAAKKLGLKKVEI